MQVSNGSKWEETNDTGTSSGDLMVSYWNHFDSISFADLKESDIQNKILVYGLTAKDYLINLTFNGCNVSFTKFKHT